MVRVSKRSVRLANESVLSRLETDAGPRDCVSELKLILRGKKE